MICEKCGVDKDGFIEEVKRLQAIESKAKRLREMFEAERPNELLVAHGELADVLDSPHNATGTSQLEGAR